jgi:hypothetical protein
MTADTMSLIVNDSRRALAEAARVLAFVLEDYHGGSSLQNAQRAFDNASRDYAAKLEMQGMDACHVVERLAEPGCDVAELVAELDEWLDAAGVPSAQATIRANRIVDVACSDLYGRPVMSAADALAEAASRG